ncbi:amino acid ABC transporter permease [Thermosediminibacter litoriperuensis]|uniref:Amino acid ABC transporter membrane protein, PAAT family (TC 3.A.1.3.-) n=1 Tax=Thermosediminibacter litoriperuensis TaxID=291989 RepID=A0A5S5AXI2_9FIRM|nr:amino acid ABC transporter permease [Thermosediminibacter litoriperuensis]TYP58577.1 amino acid ABC transporter membrane protein, PAAT family (TC 3.A.1.3.-) [Thermosediminibacter litoriperuensis]
MTNLDFTIVLPYINLFFRGALTAVEITLLAVLIGIFIGTFVGMGKMSRVLILKLICSTYVEIIRGTPLLVQLLIFYFGLPQILGFTIPEFPAAVLALGINSGGYVAEIVRGGILAVDRGQMEAARSLGMSHAQAMRYIILPQAFKKMIPPLGNEFVTLLKNSSLATTIGFQELTRAAQIVAGSTYRPFEPYITAAAFYLIMTLGFSWILGVLERRLAAGD